MADGEETVDVNASNINELLAELEIAHPELKAAIESGVSVVVDGKIITNDITAAVSEKSEIYLMQKLRGG